MHKGNFEDTKGVFLEQNTKKQKLKKGIVKFTFIPAGIVLLSIFWPDPIPLSEYCFDVVTIFPKYTTTKNNNRA
jgi:hypothetical protein